MVPVNPGDAGRRRHLPAQDRAQGRRPGVVVTLLAAAMAAALLGASIPVLSELGDTPAEQEAVTPVMWPGLVTDETGAPLAGVDVTSTDGQSLRTGEDGKFPIDSTAVYTAQKAEHLSRAAAATADSPLHLVLRAEADAVSLRFGGDVMFGRRFYEASSERPAHLKLGASAEDHSRLLSAVAPLLTDSDIAVVNLESPLVAEPYFMGDKRPEGFHPTKNIAFASALESAGALKQSGVDLVTLGNNHAADGLGPGIMSTLQALDAEGILHTGAGLTEDQAWEPAIITVRGRMMAFISCTTIDGAEGDIPNVAGPDTPGAAECGTDRLDAAVRAAAMNAEVVTVMIHGGVEYQRAQSSFVQDLTATAELAGATVIVNGHPHVAGGLRAVDGTVIAESTGNLLFDQTLWSTMLSYLLRMDITADGVPELSTDAISLQDFLPRPAVGNLADASARLAAGTVQGTAQLTGGGATIRPGETEPGETVRRSVPTGVHRITPGWWISEPGEQVRVGQDLLWGTGDFTDHGADTVAEPSALWTLGQFAELSPAGACGDGLGLQLLRSPISLEDVFISTRHRQQITAGSSLSLLAEVRGASRGGNIELSWYDGNRGESVGGIQVPIPESSADAECELVRIDAVVPPGITAVQPFLKLTPPTSDTLSSSLYVDDIRLIEWAEPGSAGRLYDSVEGAPGTSSGFTTDPAADADSPEPLPEIP
jgi:hypothetical protein